VCPSAPCGFRGAGGRESGWPDGRGGGAGERGRWRGWRSGRGLPAVLWAACSAQVTRAGMSRSCWQAFRKQRGAQRLGSSRETVTVAVKAWDWLVRVEVTDCGGPGCRGCARPALTRRAGGGPRIPAPARRVHHGLRGAAPHHHVGLPAGSAGRASPRRVRLPAPPAQTAGGGGGSCLLLVLGCCHGGTLQPDRGGQSDRARVMPHANGSDMLTGAEPRLDGLPGWTGTPRTAPADDQPGPDRRSSGIRAGVIRAGGRGRSEWRRRGRGILSWRRCG
jgi:hypothetical protein